MSATPEADAADEQFGGQRKRSGMFVVLNRLVRPLLWPIMAAVELSLLVAGWVCAVVHPATAERIVRLAERLPDLKWYWPNNSLTVSPNAKREANTSGGIGST